MGVLLRKVHDVSREVDRLFEATRQLPRGSVIEHSRIAELTGLTHGITPWMQAIKKWKKRMLAGDSESPGACLKAVPGVGYRILTTKEQIEEEPERLQRSSDRRIRQAASVIAAIRDEELSEPEVRYRVSALNSLADVAKQSKLSREKRKGWLGNPDSLPRLTQETEK